LYLRPRLSRSRTPRDSPAFLNAIAATSGKYCGTVPVGGAVKGGTAILGKQLNRPPHETPNRRAAAPPDDDECPFDAKNLSADDGDIVRPHIALRPGC